MHRANVACEVGRSGLGIGSAVFALLMPKCPLCVAAWAWGFSVLGLDFEIYNSYKWPVMAGLLVVAALVLGRYVKPRGRLILVSLSVLGLAAKLYADSEFSAPVILAWLLGTAVVASLGYFGWGRRRPVACSDCSA
ncbi:MAG: hypothetical protein JSS72_03755 [Armatimonadetes bacterium]|nr:hypothetical protein [Armatimonadota bacterium]